MTPTRWWILVFWVVVAAGILKSCYDFEMKQEKEAAAQAPPPLSPFLRTAPPVDVSSTAPAAAADVRQIAFTTQQGVPTAGFFTCSVTLKNEGMSKAKNISVRVRPYRGAMFGSIDRGYVAPRILEDSDPLSQYGSSVSFPDLAPGQSSTQTASFLVHPNIQPGYNPNPEITFDTVK